MRTAAAVTPARKKGLLSFWRELFGDKVRFWRFASGVLGVLSILKGLHRPMAWAYTQAQLDYRHGFIRRGLVGATVGRAFGLNHYAHFLAFAYGTLGMALVLFGVLLFRRDLPTVLPHGEVVALITSSFAVTYLVHLAGYSDVLLFFVATAFVLFGQTARIVTAPLLFTGGLLMHENFLLLFVPVRLLALVIGQRGASKGKQRGTWYAAAYAVLAVALTVKIALHAAMSPAMVDRFRGEIAAQSDGQLNPSVFDVLTVSTRETLRIVWSYASHSIVWSHLVLPTLVLFVPTLSVLTCLHLRLARGIQGFRGLPALCVAAGLSPLLLCFLGVDYARWTAHSVLATVLVLCLLCRRTEQHKLIVAPAMRHLVLLVLMLNVAGADQLMGGLSANTYPYTQPLLSGANALFGHSRRPLP